MSKTTMTWGVMFLVFLGAICLSAIGYLISSYAIYWLWPYAFGPFGIMRISFGQAAALVAVVWVLSFPFKYSYEEKM